MRAVVWKGIGEIAVEEVADPKIEEPTDAIVRLTASAICGTDLHFIRGTMPGMKKGMILGHEGSVQLFTTITDWLHLNGHEKAMRIGVGTAELIASLLLLVPATQIVFGTDFPFGNVSATAAGVQTSGFSAAELRGIYREHALKILPKYM